MNGSNNGSEAGRIKPNVAQILVTAIKHIPTEVALFGIRELVIDSARQKNSEETGEAIRPAWIKLGIPDQEVVALRGKPENATSVLIMARVPAAFAVELERQMNSKLAPPSGGVLVGPDGRPL